MYWLPRVYGGMPVQCPFLQFAKPEPYYAGQEQTTFEKVNAGEFPRGTVSKCDFCMDRVDKGLEPACVQSCPTRARIFGDLDDPSSEISTLVANEKNSTLHTELGTGPMVYYLPERNK